MRRYTIWGFKVLDRVHHGLRDQRGNNCWLKQADVTRRRLCWFNSWADQNLGHARLFRCGCNHRILRKWLSGSKPLHLWWQCGGVLFTPWPTLFKYARGRTSRDSILLSHSIKISLIREEPTYNKITCKQKITIKSLAPFRLSICGV